MSVHFWRFIVLFFTLSAGAQQQACECPPTTLSATELEQYDVIFRGIVDSVKGCDDRPGEAYFRVEELHKGKVPEKFVMIFRCDGPCAKGFLRGDEWIIYTNYLQLDNGAMNWCSRSRKKFNSDKEDYYLVNYGVSYAEESEFLNKTLGIRRVVESTSNQAGKRNLLPDKTQSVVILIISLAGLVLFYILFRKFFK